MSKTHAAIDTRLQAFIEAQKMFFVATAPSGPIGHVNLSPKGLDSFRVLGPLHAAYLDYTGSGAETIAHVRENGRIVVMFCAFDGPPNIVRLHGKGRVVEPRDAGFDELLAHFDGPRHPGLRAIIHIDIERVSDSCGFAVPRYDFIDQRTQLPAWASKKSDAELDAYRRQKNSQSLDGLPTLRTFDQ